MAWEAFGIGLLLGLTLGLPPGPIIAQMAVDVARGKPMSGIGVGLGAVTADACFFTLVALGLLVALPPDGFLVVLSVAGALLMGVLARDAVRVARQPDKPTRRVLNGFPGGFMLAVLSPFNIGWWLTAGVTFLAIHGNLLAVGFFTGLLGVVFGYTGVFHLGAKRFPRMVTYVGYTSGVFLAAFALFLLVHAWALVA